LSSATPSALEQRRRLLPKLVEVKTYDPEEFLSAFSETIAMPQTMREWWAVREAKKLARKNNEVELEQQRNERMLAESQAREEFHNRFWNNDSTIIHGPLHLEKT
jgi:hypothetical protein